MSFLFVDTALWWLIDKLTVWKGEQLDDTVQCMRFIRSILIQSFLYLWEGVQVKRLQWLAWKLLTAM